MSPESAASQEKGKRVPPLRAASRPRVRRRAGFGKSVLSSKGQITVPVEVRRALGLRTGDQVAYRVVAGCAELVPIRGSILDAAGSVKASGKPPSRGDIRRTVKAAVAERIAKEGR